MRGPSPKGTVPLPRRNPRGQSPAGTVPLLHPRGQSPAGTVPLLHPRGRSLRGQSHHARPRDCPRRGLSLCALSLHANPNAATCLSRWSFALFLLASVAMLLNHDSAISANTASTRTGSRTRRVRRYRRECSTHCGARRTTPAWATCRFRPRRLATTVTRQR